MMQTHTWGSWVYEIADVAKSPVCLCSCVHMCVYVCMCVRAYNAHTHMQTHAGLDPSIQTDFKPDSEYEKKVLLPLGRFDLERPSHMHMGVCVLVCICMCVCVQSNVTTVNFGRGGFQEARGANGNTCGAFYVSHRKEVLDAPGEWYGS